MPGWTRRELLQTLSLLGFGAACGPAPSATAFRPEPEPPSPRLAELEPLAYASNLRALMDTLWPATRDAAGRVVVPGALEVDAERVLRLDRFLVLAKAQGLLPGVSKDLVEDQPAFDVAFARVMERDLDVLAQLQQPLSTFRELPSDLRFAAVDAGFRDAARAPLLQFVHAACVIAFYGAVSSDRGLVSIGFPEFEDLAAGVAVSGYPKFGPDGAIDDFTFNRAPEATPGDDLSAVLDVRGDLV